MKSYIYSFNKKINKEVVLSENGKDRVIYNFIKEFTKENDIGFEIGLKSINKKLIEWSKIEKRDAILINENITVKDFEKPIKAFFINVLLGTLKSDKMVNCYKNSDGADIVRIEKFNKDTFNYEVKTEKKDYLAVLLKYINGYCEKHNIAIKEVISGLNK